MSSNIGSNIHSSSSALDNIGIVPFGAEYLSSSPITLIVTDLGHCNIIRLTWNAVTGAAKYVIFRNWKQICSTTVARFDDTNGFDFQNTYTVVAVDAQGQQSAASNGVTVYSPKTAAALKALRSLLLDRGGVFKGVLGSNTANTRRWTDEDLVIYLQVAVSDVNSLPSMTSFTLESIQTNLYGLVLERAVILAISGRGIFEIARQLAYNDSGVSIQIDRASLYSSYMTGMQGDWYQRASRTKKAMMLSAVAALQVDPVNIRVRVLSPAQIRLR